MRFSLRKVLTIILCAQMIVPASLFAGGVPYRTSVAIRQPLIETPLTSFPAAGGQDQIPSAQCFDPGPTIEDREAELERIQNAYAFMTWKAAASMAPGIPSGMPVLSISDGVDRTRLLGAPGGQGQTRMPLFDVRFCDPGWNCATPPELGEDVDRIMTVGEAAHLVSSARAAEKLSTTATAESLLSLIGSRLKAADDSKAKEGIKLLIDQKVAQWRSAELEHLANVKADRQQMIDMANLYEKNLRWQFDLEKEISERPEGKKQLGYAKQAAEEFVREHRKDLEERMANHRRDVSAAAEMKGAREAFERGKRYYEHLDLLNKGIQTAVNVQKNDWFGTSKAMLSLLTKINNDYFIEWLKADIKATEKPIKDAVKFYNRYSWATSRWMLSVPAKYRQAANDGTIYGPMFQQASSAVTAAQAKYQPELVTQLTRLEALKEGFKQAKTWIPTLEKVWKYWQQWAETRKRLTPTDVIEANRNATLRASMPPATRDAIRYFKDVSIILGYLADFMEFKIQREYPDPKNGAWFAAGVTAGAPLLASQFVSVGVLGAIVSMAAAYFKIASGTIEAFTRLTDWANQGFRLTPSGDLLAREDVFSGHPALRGLRAFVNQDDTRFVRIPNLNEDETAVISRQDFDKLMTALSTWTSLTGRNPDQTTIYLLATRGLVGIDVNVPYFDAGRFTLMPRTFTLQSLSDLSQMHVEEEQIGAVIRELTFINEATKGLDEPYSYQDLFDPTDPSSASRARNRRNRFSELANYHTTLDRAYRIAYGAPITPNVFGAVLAQSAPDATAVTSTSPLQKRILERALDMQGMRQTAPPVAISWLNPDERLPAALNVTMSLEIGALPPDTQVCRSVVAHYPDGSTQTARLVPPQVTDSALTSTFTIPLDWKKLQTSTAIAIEATATAGAHRDVDALTVELAKPVTVDDAYALPTVAYPGTELKLNAAGIIAPVTEDADVQIHFILEREGASPETLEATFSELMDGFNIFANADYKVPENVPPGTLVKVTARMKMGDYESSTTTGFNVVRLPDPNVTSFAPTLTIRVTGAGETADNTSPVGAGVIVTASNGLQGTTNDAGVVQLGTFTEGTFTLDAKPTGLAEGEYGPASTSVSLTDFNPATDTDPNQYVIDMVLPRADHSETQRALDAIKVQAQRLLAMGARVPQLTATVVNQSQLAFQNAGEAGNLLIEMQQADQTLRQSNPVCMEYDRLQGEIDLASRDAARAETEMRTALDQALALASSCSSQADADQIRTLQNTAIQRAGRIGVLEKQARAGNARLGEILDRVKALKELFDAQKKRIETIGEKAAAAIKAAGDTEAAVDALLPIIRSWPGDASAATSLYQDLRMRTPLNVLRKEFADVGQLIGGLNNLNIGPASAEGILGARQTARNEANRASDYKARASALAPTATICETKSMDDKVDEMGAMTTGATIELAAAADLPTKANDCIRRLQQSAACNAMAADAQRMISLGNFQDANRKIAEMKANRCDTSALEAQLFTRMTDADRLRLQNGLANAVNSCQFQNALTILGQLEGMPNGLQGVPGDRTDRNALTRAANAQREIENVRARLQVARPDEREALRAQLNAAKAALPPNCIGDVDSLLATVAVLNVPPRPDIFEGTTTTTEQKQVEQGGRGPVLGGRPPVPENRPPASTENRPASAGTPPSRTSSGDADRRDLCPLMPADTVTRILSDAANRTVSCQAYGETAEKWEDRFARGQAWVVVTHFLPSMGNPRDSLNKAPKSQPTTEFGDEGYVLTYESRTVGSARTTRTWVVEFARGSYYVKVETNGTWFERGASIARQIDATLRQWLATNTTTTTDNLLDGLFRIARIDCAYGPSGDLVCRAQAANFPPNERLLFRWWVDDRTLASIDPSRSYSGEEVVIPRSIPPGTHQITVMAEKLRDGGQTGVRGVTVTVR